ncbi:MAG TPA: serine hydrolase [Anaerolineae bacterium]|nr:serine hydrolase [Anaerolineae bacterium]
MNILLKTRAKIIPLKYLLGWLLVLTLAALAQPGLPATAQTTGPSATDPNVSPQAALERLFTSDTIEDAWFSDTFLAQTPLAQIETVLAQLIQEAGDFQQVEGETSPFTVRFAHGQTTAAITLDSAGRIIGLFFAPLIPLVNTPDEAIEQFAALPGQVSVLVLEDGEALAALNADESLAVGSAFKLAILAALRAQTEAGQHRWDEVVTLDPAWKSLPGGILQDWPAESPLTVHTLATLMISISDNTATDTLLHLVGRSAVEEYAGDNRPLLTTQEIFKLKALPNANWLTEYQAGDEGAKRQVLAELADLPLPAPADFPSTPNLAVEWFFRPGELCELIRQGQDLDLMTVNPGVASPADWARVAFKGGSETGVLNLTHWLEADNGATYCVVVTQNRTDAAVNEAQLTALTRALIGTLRR